MMRRAPRARAASDSRLLVPLLLSALLLRADACSSNSVTSHADTTQVCGSAGTSYEGQDVCIVVVENSAHSTCNDFCVAAGSSCVYG